VRADVPELLRALLRRSAEFGDRENGWDPSEVKSWRARARRAVTRFRAEPALATGSAIGADGFFEALRRAMPREGRLVTDSGLHQMLARRHFRVLTPHGLVVPSDFQSMGFGLPAAIGASLADPGRPVVALIGDGGLALSGLELLTAVRENVRLTVIVFNDGGLGLIRLQQLSAHGTGFATTMAAPDIGLLARSVGASYTRLDDDVDGCLATAVAGSGVQLLEVPLTESMTMRAMQAKGIVRSAVSRAPGVGSLRRIVARRRRK
jgi:acetolactate synthase-1/2/3 large subunit